MSSLHPSATGLPLRDGRQRRTTAGHQGKFFINSFTSISPVVPPGFPVSDILAGPRDNINTGKPVRFPLPAIDEQQDIGEGT